MNFVEEENCPSENTVRIMKWNLDGLSFEKAHNPGVVCVMARLLARYHITVAIIQGITDSLGLKEVTIFILYSFKFSALAY